MTKRCLGLILLKIKPGSVGKHWGALAVSHLLGTHPTEDSTGPHRFPGWGGQTPLVPLGQTPGLLPHRPRLQRPWLALRPGLCKCLLLDQPC